MNDNKNLPFDIGQSDFRASSISDYALSLNELPVTDTVGGQNGETPYTNRGVAVPVPLSYTSRIGWLTLSFKAPTICQAVTLRRAVMDLVERHLVDEWVDKAPPILLYKECLLSSTGLKLCYTVGVSHFSLVFPQAMCDRIVTKYTLHLVADLLALGAKATRLDVYIDDLQRLVDILDVYQRSRTKERVTRSRSVNYEFKDNPLTGQIKKHIVRFGERCSDFYVRLYDKKAETKGLYCPIRLEAELKGKLAHFALNLLLSAAFPQSKGLNNCEDINLTQFGTAIAELIGSKLDFRDPDSNSRVDRRVRSSWYDALLQGASRIKIDLPRRVDTLQKTKEWLFKSVAASLAIFREVLKGDFDSFLDDLLTRGQIKLTWKHWAKIFEPVMAQVPLDEGV